MKEIELECKHCKHKECKEMRSCCKCQLRFKEYQENEKDYYIEGDLCWK